MQLTLHADYAFRVLLYLGSRPPGTVATTREISQSYGISKHHLVRVVQTLSDCGYVELKPGRAGGVSLACEARSIRLGDVARSAETNLRVVECFDRKTNTCPIVAMCQLKPVLAEALDAFLAVLDRYTLADLLDDRSRARLSRVFGAALAKQG